MGPAGMSGWGRAAGLQWWGGGAPVRRPGLANAVFVSR